VPKTVSRRSVLRALGAGLIAGSASPSIAKSYAHHVELNTRTLTLPHWSADGFKLAFLSDLHMNSAAKLQRAREAARLAISVEPDVIILGGDYLDLRHPSIVQNVATFLAEFREARCPVVAVMGNHDYWSGAARPLLEEFSRSPVRMLRNDLFEVEGVTLAGIDDAIEGRQRMDFFPKGRVSPSIISVFHEPDFVREMPDHVSLQISGHSHGGQVCLPFGAPLYTPFGARDYTAGFYRKARVPVFVTRGVGTTGPDFRVFCAPEVSVLTLRGAA
jgi:predicted MPP superfamily phosphohydrolase